MCSDTVVMSLHIRAALFLGGEDIKEDIKEGMLAAVVLTALENLTERPFGM